MTIVQIIKQHALELFPNTGESPNVQPFTFLFGSKEILNLKTDEQIFPVVGLVDTIRSNAVDSLSGYKRHTYTLSILLLDKSELDYDEETQHQPIIERMRKSCDELVERITRDNVNVDSVVKSYTVDDIYNLFDVNLTGVLLTLTITPFNKNNICIS